MLRAGTAIGGHHARGAWVVWSPQKANKTNQMICNFMVFNLYLSSLTDGFKWDKEDLMDVLHWWKQAIALIMGVVCGLVPFVHMAGFLLFAIVMVTLTIMFYRSYLG